MVEELAARGHRAVDTDYGGLSELVSVPDDVETGLGIGKDWVWREDRIRELLLADDTDLLFIGGTSPNQGKFYSMFDHIVLLTAPETVIVERPTTRTNNPYGKRPEEITRTLHLMRTIEPMLRERADHILNTDASLERVMSRLLRIVDKPNREHPIP